MKLYGRAAVSEFLGDNVMYRTLTPIDSRLPGLADLHTSAGLAAGFTPRKTSPEYAKIAAQILVAAREISQPGTSIERIVFVGDTRLNDSTAFANICRAGNWPGQAFIGAEKDGNPAIDLEEIDIGMVMGANKWAALTDFQAHLAAQDFPIDAHTAVLLDLDKTTLGARGRNDQVINQARVDAAILTIQAALGNDFDRGQLQSVYDYFNQTRFHPFTTDNQDYLVYICLVVLGGLFTQHGLKCAIDNNFIEKFKDLLVQVERRSVELSPEIKNIHQEVYQYFQNGDPTPFKAFRRAEYRATAARMGHLGAETPMDERLTQEIVITHEVRQLMKTWKSQGALLFGLSDKPDEASIPTPELAAQGYLPIHRIETSVVGE